MNGIAIRDARADDVALLNRILLVAINWNPNRPAADERVVRARPDLRHYIEAWPRSGDLGVVAESATSGPIAAAWLRRFPAEDPGYGFVAADVPELTIGVLEGYRGRGVGAALLDALIGRASARGNRAISLSVERGNEAVHLYRSRGFREVGSTADAMTMLLELAGEAG